jgi:hypothetical protein
MATVATRRKGGELDAKAGENAIQRSAVINPYALAEVVAGRKIAWSRVDDRPRLLEELLQTPYGELFDPKFDSPLYVGFRLNDELRLVQDEVELPKEPPANANDLEQLPLDAATIRTLADLGPVFRTKDVGSIEVERADFGSSAVEVRLRLSDTLRKERLARVLSPELLQVIVHRPDVHDAYLPPAWSWVDTGEFFHEAAEYFDPIQGAVANCYLIAAMASIAWARPYMIGQLTRATGQGQQQFVDMIRFHDIDHGNAEVDVEVTEATLVSTSTGQPLYCRSSEAGEIWPAVYEKAFAKWKTGTTSDYPDITATAWGDCVRASAELTGLGRHYYETASMSADDLWNTVRANSLSGRTFNPMTAATYGSGDASPDHVNYADANLVAAHCYSVLGWAYESGQKYIVLRNPWGNTEATLGVLGGTEWFYDVSWWRPIVLSNPDGVFALRADVFKSYFGWLGAVS